MGFSIKTTVYILGIVYALFTMWSNSYGLIMSPQRNAIHLGIVIVILLLKSIEKRKSSLFKLLDWSILIFSVFAIGYFFYEFPILHKTRGSVPIPTDITIGFIFIIILLEVTRRSVGFMLPLIAGFLLIYARFGEYFPSMFSHPGYTWSRIIFRNFMTAEGIWGTTLEVSSTYIALFILFGTFLEMSGASTFFQKMTHILAKRGGPAGAAQAAMISSGIMGTISGSAAANVATTGAITIPLMKKLGYSPEQAGAIEAVASTGGMIMPPIMGAAAFLMATILAIPYVDVVKAAVMPAVLYYLVGMVCVQLMTNKRLQEIKFVEQKAEQEETNNITVRDLMIDGIPIFSSIFIIVTLLLMGRSVTFTGFMGIITTLLTTLVFKFKDFKFRKILDAMAKSVEGIIEIATVCASAGIIIMVITSTGAGMFLAQNLIRLAGGNLFFALVIIALLSLILTMGMPATALYVVMVTSIGTALVKLGADLLAVHFFMFWYGVIGNLTPPVAMAIITAAGIARTSMWKIAPIALRLGVVGFTIPFMFVYFPQLLGVGITSWVTGLRVFVTVLLGGVALAIGLENFLIRKLKWFERISAFICAVLLLLPEKMTDIFGLFILLMTIIFHFRRVRFFNKTS